MDAWTELTVDVVRNALPNDLATLYGSWVDANPAKANRMGELVAEVRSAFRVAVASNPWNGMDENPDTVPWVGFTHALNLVIFQLGMEMGTQFAPEVYGLNVQAQVWLRMVQSRQILVDRVSREGTPSYLPPMRACLVAG